MPASPSLNLDDLVTAVYCALDDALAEAGIECHEGNLIQHFKTTRGSALQNHPHKALKWSPNTHGGRLSYPFDAVLQAFDLDSSDASV